MSSSKVNVVRMHVMLSAWTKKGLDAEDDSGARATLSHVNVGVRDLRNRTADVVAAVRAGQVVTLTSNGEPIADIVPHRRRARWLPGGWLRSQLSEAQADPALRQDLDRLAGARIDQL